MTIQPKCLLSQAGSLASLTLLLSAPPVVQDDSGGALSLTVGRPETLEWEVVTPANTGIPGDNCWDVFVDGDDRPLIATQFIPINTLPNGFANPISIDVPTFADKEVSGVSFTQGKIENGEFVEVRFDDQFAFVEQHTTDIAGSIESFGKWY